MAYNNNLGDTAALASIGGGPFFTSLEDQTLDAVSGDKSESVLLSLEYQFAGYLTLGAAAGQFTALNKNDYNKEELNLFINYSWNEMLTAELMYAAIDDRNSEPDMRQVRAILTYRY